MKLLKKIENIRNYVLNDESIIYYNQEHLYINDIIYNIEIVICKYDFYGNLWIQDYEGESYCLKKDKLMKLDFHVGINSTINQIILSVKNNKLNIFDIETWDILFELPLKSINRYFYDVISKLIFVYEKQKNVYSLSKTGNQQWQTDISEYGEIRKILGVEQDTLWVTLNLQDENSGSNLVAININTGEVKKTFYNIWREFNSYDVSFIKENRFLVSIRNQTFLEFDTESLVETRKLNLESLVVKNLKIKRYIIYKDKIYFTAVNGKYIVANTIGVLDYDTLEVLWHTKLDVGTNQYPQVTDDKLYILNKNDELLIFDRTDKQI